MPDEELHYGALYQKAIAFFKTFPPETLQRLYAPVPVDSTCMKEKSRTDSVTEQSSEKGQTGKQTPSDKNASWKNGSSAYFTNETLLELIESFLDTVELDDFLNFVESVVKEEFGKKRKRDTEQQQLDEQHSQRTLNVCFRLRLDSLFGFFRLLKVYADQMQRLGYDWSEWCNLMMPVARTLANAYGPFRVHPLHAALVGEKMVINLITENNGKRNNLWFRELTCVAPSRIAIPSSGLESLKEQKESGSVSGNAVVYCEIFDDQVKKKELRWEKIESLRIEDTEIMMGVSDKRHFPDHRDEDELLELDNEDDPEFTSKRALEFLNDALDEAIRLPITDIPYPSREFIQRRQVPIIWLFRINTCDPLVHGIVFVNDGTDAIDIVDWWTYECCDEPPIFLKVGKQSCVNYNSLSHFFCCGEVNGGPPHFGSLELLLRLAFLKAHHIPPFDKASLPMLDELQTTIRDMKDAEDTSDWDVSRGYSKKYAKAKSYWYADHQFARAPDYAASLN